MKTLVAIAFATVMLVAMSSEASAWYCRASGYGGSGWGRSDSRERARLLALYECAKRGRNCRLQSCVP